MTKDKRIKVDCGCVIETDVYHDRETEWANVRYLTTCPAHEDEAEDKKP